MKLNLPPFSFKIQEVNGKKQIFDPIRKRFVALTPEEWVRQHLLRLFIEQYNVPSGLIGVEQSVKVATLSQRSDIVIFNRLGVPVVIVEVKAPSVAITQDVLDQASRYNMRLKVKFLVLSNGLCHLILRFDAEKKGYVVLDRMPSYEEIISS